MHIGQSPLRPFGPFIVMSSFPKIDYHLSIAQQPLCKIFSDYYIMELAITALIVIAIVAGLGMSMAVDIIIPAQAVSIVGQCASALKNASSSLCHRIQ
jgi:hypothetical protein